MRTLKIWGMIAVVIIGTASVMGIYAGLQQREANQAAAQQQKLEQAQRKKESQAEPTQEPQAQTSEREASSPESAGGETERLLSAEDAARIALSKINQRGHVQKVKLEVKDGRRVYEVEIKGRMEGKMWIDAWTGTILGAEIEDKDDNDKKDDD